MPEAVKVGSSCHHNEEDGEDPAYANQQINGDFIPSIIMTVSLD